MLLPKDTLLSVVRHFAHGDFSVGVFLHQDHVEDDGSQKSEGKSHDDKGIHEQVVAHAMKFIEEDVECFAAPEQLGRHSSVSLKAAQEGWR